MRVLITGSSSGIGKACAEIFLEKSHEVVGFDICKASIDDILYTHYIVDVGKGPETYPDIGAVDIIINNAGVQSNELDAIKVNLVGAINICEHYGYNPNIKSVVNVCSTSAHNGAEFAWYSASKGGLLAYTKNFAQRIAQFGATCNSISPGGVITPINKHIMEDAYLYDLCKEETLLSKWASAEEIANWIYFMSVKNKSMTGQDIIIDNGEMCNYNFIW